jgi:hypothetical protein
MLRKDKAAFKLATYFHQRKLTGKVASNGNYSFMRQVAFYAGNQYYESTPQQVFSAQLPLQLKLHKVHYYYLFYPDEGYVQALMGAPVVKSSKRTWKLNSHKILVLEF